MPINTHSTIADSHLQLDGRRYVKHSFVDHLGKTTEKPYSKVDGVWTETEYSIERVLLIPQVEEDLALAEVNEQLSIAESGSDPDKVAQHQTQADFDRRFLGRSMLFDAQPFFNCKPVYDRVLTEGNNTAQRAVYLGVPTSEFTLINTRYNNVSGVEWFLNDEKGQQWPELHSEFV